MLPSPGDVALFVVVLLLLCWGGAQGHVQRRACTQKSDCAPLASSLWCYASYDCQAVPEGGEDMRVCVYEPRCSEPGATCIPRLRICAECLTDATCPEPPASWCNMGRFCNTSEGGNYACTTRPRCHPEGPKPVCNATARQCQAMALSSPTPLAQMGSDNNIVPSPPSPSPPRPKPSRPSNANSGLCATDACCQALLHAGMGLPAASGAIPWCAGTVAVDELTGSGCVFVPRCPNDPTACNETAQTCGTAEQDGAEGSVLSTSPVVSAGSNSSMNTTTGSVPYAIDSSNMWWWAVILALAIFAMCILVAALLTGCIHPTIDNAAANIILPEDAVIDERTTREGDFTMLSSLAAPSRFANRTHWE